MASNRVLSAGQVIHCTSEQHYHDILKEAGESLVVVDCFADWCPPCKAMSPVFEGLAKQYKHVVFVKVDVEKVPRVAKLVGVWAMPTFAFYKSGVKVGSFMGASERKLRQGLDNDGDLGACSSFCCIQ